MTNNHHNHPSGNHSHHLVPLNVYYGTLIALLILTVVTVGVSYIDFGKANIFISLGIAAFKASLVMTFFMGLKYDSNLNRAVILSSFVALFLFIFFAAADSWTRQKPVPVAVKSEAPALGKNDLAVFEAGSPALVEKGKEIFAVNCSSCHGATGSGDGIAAAALNPKPRNFHGPLSAWKNGASVKSIYVTLAYGVTGSGMASYKALPASDRFALAHFIRSMTPERPASAGADGRYEVALKEDGIGGNGPAAKPVIPVDFALERMSK